MIKKIITAAITILLSAGAVLGEMHEFRLPDGRSIKAEILDYNEVLEQVELKLANKQRKKIKASIFVAEDQKYIKDWAALNGFRNPSSFKVECNKKTVEKWKEDGSIYEVKYERKIYEIKVENRTSQPIEGLTAEYRIYYEQEESRPGQSKTTSKLDKSGALDLERMRAKESRTFKTESIVLNSQSFNSADFYYDSGDPENTEGELKGIWLRITAKTPGGQTAVRDIYEPQSIKGKYRW